MRIMDVKLIIIFLSIIVSMTILTIPNDAKLGEIYFRSYKFEEALHHFTKAKEIDETSPTILKKLKDYFIVQGDVDKALELQIKVCKRLPKNIAELYELSKLYDWNNDNYNQLKTREKIAELTPGKKDKNKILMEVLQGYRWIRKYDDADRIATALDENSKSSDHLVRNLEYYVATNNTKKIIQTTQRLKKYGVNNKKFKLLQAQSFELRSQYKEAIVAYKKYLSDNPIDHLYNSQTVIKSEKFYRDNLTVIEKITYLYYLAKDNERLVEFYEQIFKVAPTEFEVALDAAEIHFRDNNFARVQELSKKVIDSKKPLQLFRAGEFLTAIKDNKSALPFYKKAYSYWPRNKRIIKALAETYEELGYNKEALKLQYKLMKLLNKKNKSTKVYLGANEILVAQAGGNIKIPKHKQELKYAHEKVLFLLEKIGDKDLRHAELLKYHKQYPYDTRVLSELGYSYSERGEYTKAKEHFQKLYEMSPINKEAILFLVDDDIKNFQYKKAQERIAPIEEMDDNSVRNRLHTVYKETAPKKAKQLCKNLEDYEVTKATGYSVAELKVNCHIQEENHSEASATLLKYLDFYPNSKDAKLKLGFTYLEDYEVEKARLVLTDLESSYNKNDSDIKSLRKEYTRIKAKKELEYAWVYKAHYQHFTGDGLIDDFWDSQLDIIKGFRNSKIGLRYKLKGPIFDSENVSSIQFALIYDNIETFTLGLYYGVNKENSKTNTYLVNFEKAYSKQTQFLFQVYGNDQVYDIPNFTSDMEPLEDRVSIFVDHIFDLKNDFHFSLENQIYHAEINGSRDSARYINGSFEWDHKSKDPLWFGTFTLVQNRLSEATDLKDIIPRRVTLLALHAKYVKQFTPKFLNKSRIYLGHDIHKDNSDFGDFISIKNESVYTFKTNNDFTFSAEWIKEAAFSYVSNIQTIYLGYRGLY